MSNDHPTWRQAIGRRLRELRSDLELRQDDVARGAQNAGLDWTQATVAAIERDRRGVSAEEFLLLPLALWHATQQAKGFGAWFPLADLLPESGWIRLTEGASVYVGTLRGMLSGVQPDPHRPFDGEFETPGEGRVSDVERAMGEWRSLARLWPGASLADLERAGLAATREAERKAARKLGVPPQVVSVAAYARWGRSFTEERDRRVAEQARARSPVPRLSWTRPGEGAKRAAEQAGAGLPPGTLHALRGHVTRALVAELAEVLGKEAGD